MHPAIDHNHNHNLALNHILVAKDILTENEIKEGKNILKKIVSMLIGLIKSHLPDRIAESQAHYGGE